MSRRTVMTDETYVKVSARQLWDGLGLLFPSTLLGLLLAAPWLVATLLGAEGLTPLLCAICGAPAWAGLVTVAAKLSRGESASPLDVLSAARRRYGAAALVGGATAGFGWLFDQSLAAIGSGNVLAMALVGVSATLTVALLAIDLYAFPLLALFDAPLLDVARNAAGLAAAAPAATLGLLSAGTLAVLALTWLGPGTLLATLPTLAILTVNNALLQLDRFGHAPDQMRSE